MANTFEDLREIVMRELDEINKRGELDENTLICVYKLVDIIKDINEIETGEEGGYAMMNSRMAYPYYAMEGGSYRGGGNSNASYARNSYARNRDSMGRYSRENSYENSYRGGYSREGERDEIMEKMRRMMESAASETERQVIQRIMNQV